MRLDLRFDLLFGYLLIFVVTANFLFDNRCAAIHNGQNADIGQFPYTVYVKNSGKTCTGIILSASRVLTAAHCVCEDYGETTVVAGIIDINNRGASAQEVSVDSVEYEPDYYAEGCTSSNFLPPNDIAILNLKSALSLSNDIAVANLDCAAPKTGTATIIGFGEDQDDKRGVLKYAGQNYRATNDNLYLVSDRSNTEIGPGDSGGPLSLSSGSVIGVILGQEVDRNTYCDLSQYCDWINKT